MKVLLCCISDWAGLQFLLAKSLRAIGIDAQDYFISPHPFAYTETSKQVSLPRMREIISESESGSLVIFTHGEIVLLNHTRDNIVGKMFAVGFTGSAYRKAPETHNSVFNSHVNFTLTDQCEFMKLGAKNIHYFAAPFETKDTPKFGHEIKQPYRVGHYPSNPEVKGTEKILQMIEEMRVLQPDSEFTLMHSLDRVTHDEQLRRMNDCDIYIELFKPTLDGKPYGCWGVTAFEAAAAGKIVVTQNINLHVYEAAYGQHRKGGVPHPTERTCPFFICNTEERFIDNLSHLLTMTPTEISHYQTDTYNWVTKKHNFEETGKYLLSIFRKYIR